MSINRYDKTHDQLIKLAGNTILLDATASEIRSGTFSIQCQGDSGANATITFETPMPDTDYVVIFESDSPAAGEIGFRGKTTTGFNLYVLGGRGDTVTYTFTGKYYAFRLIELDGYTALQNKVSNPDSTPTENSTNLVTSGGVYDAISSASKIFIDSESAWNELDAETKATYQVAILTDKPNVNAVDSTDGSTTVVGEPNKRWVGSQNEWDNLTTAEKAKYEIVCFNDDNGASGKDIYSTAETKTNKVWINDKPIYRKIVDIGTLPNASTKSVNHGISSLESVVRTYGMAGGSISQLPLPFVSISSNANIQFAIVGTTIDIITGVDRSAYTGWVAIEYTKTTD